MARNFRFAIFGVGAFLAATANWTQVAAARCRAGTTDCPIKIVVGDKDTKLTGRLTPHQRSVSYQFTTAAGAWTLRWRFKGPTARVILTGPDGDTEGPGLPPETILTKPGAYVFSVASNLMAEGVYGKYTLWLSLKNQ
jgi:hypothetical protein